MISSLNEKEYSFMNYVPMFPLSFSGTPLFFNAYHFQQSSPNKTN